MECVAATWDALAAIGNPLPEVCWSTWDAYGNVIDHLLINRDHQFALIASKDPDPFRLHDDPIREAASIDADDLLTRLEGETEITSLELKAVATSRVAVEFVNALNSLVAKVKQRKVHTARQ